MPENPRIFLRSLFDAAVAAAHPHRCVPAALPAPPQGRTIVVGGGKAAAAMAAAVEDHWPGPLSGLVVVRDGYACPTRTIAVAEAAHPVPDARGMAAAERILTLAGQAGQDDLVLCLISGGASSLLALPAPGVSLADKRAITEALLNKGAPIAAINCVRKHLSRIKGGRLAAAAGRASLVTLVISDVVGDDPSVIASGPTVADPSTCADALGVLRAYDVAIPAAVETGLRSGTFETPKGGIGGAVRIVARPRDALDAAARAARAQGLAVLDLGDACEGEARTVARAHADLAGEIQAGRGPVRAPCVILSGGELTVHVRGRGRGGPNTEYVLGLAAAGLKAWALAGDTDGTDGNAGAAGALLAPDTVLRAARAGLAPDAVLEANDSASFFAALGDLVETGPTFTNVNDLRAILVLPPDR